MRTWTATTTTGARPEAVLDVLTDPDAAARRAPLPFDVETLEGRRLATGSRVRASGRLAGRRGGFGLEVHEACGSALSLAATGPVGFDVDYRLSPVAGAARCTRPCPSDRPAASSGASPRRRAPRRPLVPWRRRCLACRARPSPDVTSPAGRRVAFPAAGGRNTRQKEVH